MKITLRDLLWLCVVAALVFALWREKRHSQMLATEVRYHTSAIPPVAFVETPLGDAMHFLSVKHGMTIDMDWPSLAKVGIKPDYKVTQNLADGSLTWAMERIFHNYEVEVKTVGPNSIRVSGRPEVAAKVQK